MSTDPTIIRGGERMFAHRGGHYKGLVLLSVIACISAVFLFPGCGGDQTTTISAATSEPTKGPDVANADPGDVQVIEDWSDALRQGDVKAAAGYFAIPSTAENPPLLTKIGSTDDAIAFNNSLPCGAKVISARTEGQLTTATFRLTDRPGGDCGTGTGGKASTSFDIKDGKIVEWRRIDAGGGLGGTGQSEDSAPV
jgi:limonene-1,2-epoxide hydrolase